MARENYIPKPKGGGKAFLLSGDTQRALEEALGRLEIEMDPTQFACIERGGKKYFHYIGQDGGIDGHTPGGGGAKSQYIPWDPNFLGSNKVRFNLGTINNVPADNWNQELSLPAAGQVSFVVANISCANGKVTHVHVGIESSPPSEDQIAKNTPPPNHKILLGAISSNQKQMIVQANLSMEGKVVFYESIASPSVGSEPFNRWYRWSVTASYS